MTSMPGFANKIHVISPQIMTAFKLLKKDKQSTGTNVKW